jgi:hypothetical protein
MVGADLPREVRAERAHANREKLRESDSLPPLASEQVAEGKSLGCDSSDAQGVDSRPFGYPRPGTCTACGHPAEQAPSGRWWHLGPACPNRSQTVFAVTVVEDGVMRETTDAERPARFRADD